MGKKQWTTQEIQELETLIEGNQDKNWKSISLLLKKSGYKRTQFECRHKWVNNLNPSINHGPWTDQELSTLYLQYEKSLSRWSVIQKFLPNRTQIKIKNHFYGVLRNIVRFVLKHYQYISGKETVVSNKISPNTLKSLFWGEGDYSFLKNQIRELITFMKFRFDKKKLGKIICLKEKQKIYKKLNYKILEQANIHFPVRSNNFKTKIPEKIVKHEAEEEKEHQEDQQHQEDLEDDDEELEEFEQIEKADSVADLQKLELIKSDNINIDSTEKEKMNQMSPQPNKNYMVSETQVARAGSVEAGTNQQIVWLPEWQLDNSLKTPLMVWYTSGCFSFYYGDAFNVNL